MAPGFLGEDGKLSAPLKTVESLGLAFFISGFGQAQLWNISPFLSRCPLRYTLALTFCFLLTSVPSTLPLESLSSRRLLCLYPQKYKSHWTKMI